MRSKIISLVCVGLLTLRIGVHGLLSEVPNNALSVPYAVQNDTASSLSRYSHELEISTVEKRRAKGKEKTKKGKGKRSTKNGNIKAKVGKGKGVAKNGKLKGKEKKDNGREKAKKGKGKEKTPKSKGKEKTTKDKGKKKTKKGKDKESTDEPVVACRLRGSSKDQKGTPGQKIKGGNKDLKKSKARTARGISLETRASKKLKLADIDMEFPKYPTFEEMLPELRKYKDLIDPYGPRQPDACSDDYVMTMLAFPTRQGEGNGGAEWQTEHVMDAQIVQNFFQHLMAQRFAQIPRRVLTAKQGKKSQYDSPTTTEYFTEFWQTRKIDAKNKDGSISKRTAMRHLLLQFPGTEDFTEELTLLSEWINLKKGIVFRFKRSDCIGKTRWNGLNFDDKIQELRDCVLLAKYISNPNVRASFQKVAQRISVRLSAMEEPRGFLERLNNYWEKETGDQGLRDADGETWKALGLKDIWEDWLTNFMNDRLLNLDDFIKGKIRELRLYAQKKMFNEPTRQLYTRRVLKLNAGYRATNEQPINPSPFGKHGGKLQRPKNTVV